MERGTATCPRCGEGKVTTIQLPRHHEPTEPATTQPAFRCLGCDTQWTTEAEWHDLDRQDESSHPPG